MGVSNIGILVSEKSWFVPYAYSFNEILKQNGYFSKVFFDHNNIDVSCNTVFILSYFNIIPKETLKKHLHNLVVHESDLPKGRGWAPFFWQILEGKNKIPIVLFEASDKADDGDIYIKDYIQLTGNELYSEIREKQALKTIEICLEFLSDHHKGVFPVKQKGEATFYDKRTPADSELNINKSIKEQFNLLRIANNDDFPAFFYFKNTKYILKIYKDKEL